MKRDSDYSESGNWIIGVCIVVACIDAAIVYWIWSNV